MASGKNIRDIGQRDAPPLLMIVGVVLLVLALGAGGFWAYNGGWQTKSQQEYQAQHELIPIMAARHGDTEALDKENQLRKQQGQSPLVVPKDKKASAIDDPAKLQRLQEQLRAKGGG